MNRQVVIRNRHKRSKIRARYIKICVSCSVIMMFIGLGIGVYCGSHLGNENHTQSRMPSETMFGEPGMVAEKSVTPLPTMTIVNPNVVDIDGMVWGTNKNPFKIGNSYSLMADMTATGEAYGDLTTSPFTSQNLSVSLVDFYTPDYYEYLYGDEYRLSGTEAAVVLRVYSDKPCNPQTAIILNLETASGEALEGYPLMDAAISGEYVTDTVAGQASTVYKRFQYDAKNPAVYLTLTHFHNGQAVKAYFLLESASNVPPKPTMAPSTNTTQPDATPTSVPLTSYPTLTHGDRGDAVVKLQERLIELGYLSGEADGIFGNMTLTAVNEAQRIANMEQTGIADNNFQQYLFSNDVH